MGQLVKANPHCRCDFLVLHLLILRDMKKVVFCENLLHRLSYRKQFFKRLLLIISYVLCEKILFNKAVIAEYFEGVGDAFLPNFVVTEKNMVLRRPFEPAVLTAQKWVSWLANTWPRYFQLRNAAIHHADGNIRFLLVCYTPLR